jgi:hypothetical protein
MLCLEIAAAGALRLERPVIEFDGDTSDFDNFGEYVERNLRPAIEAEVNACMQDGANRARAAPFNDVSGDTRKSIRGGVGGSLAGGPTQGEFLEGSAIGEQAIEGYIMANSDAALFLEVGTQSHEIVPRDRRTKGQAGARTRRGSRRLHFTIGGNDVFARRVQHPGTKPLNFIHESMSEDEFSNRIEKTFERVLDGRRPT